MSTLLPRLVVRRIGCVLALMLILVGCGGGGGDDAPAGIGSGGGTVSSASGARITIPAGAVAQTTVIVVEDRPPGAPPLPAGVTAYGPVVAITPHGTAFAQPATVTVPFDPAALPAGSTPTLYRAADAQSPWLPLGNAVVSGSTMSATVTSLSYYVVASPAAAAVGDPERAWYFRQFLADGLGAVDTVDQDGEPNSKTGGVVDDEHDFGAMQPLLPGSDDRATGAVFSSASGTTYWVRTESPQGDMSNTLSKIGSETGLVQKQGYRKISPNATLRLTVTRVFFEAVDGNASDIIQYRECPWLRECHGVIHADVEFDVRAYRLSTFFQRRGFAMLSGYHDNWRSDVLNAAATPGSLWKPDDFEFGTDGPGRATLRLKQPLVVEVDLSSIDEGQSFTLLVDASVRALNRRQRESAVSAFFRDPVSLDGVTIEAVGLEPVAVPFDEPPDDEPQAELCTGPIDPAAGTLQFTAASYVAAETPTGGLAVRVSRTGGTVGALSATVRSSDGTAVAGTDFAPVEANVYFAAGEDGEKLIELELPFDTVAEDDKQFTLNLTELRGCGRLGAQSSAIVSVLDDDRPEPTSPPPSGLDTSFDGDGKVALPGVGFDGGTGLALQADGKILIAGGGSRDFVRFTGFVLARFHADGRLDTDFGAAGVVRTEIPNYFVRATQRVAVQPDGKIVVAGFAAGPGSQLFPVLVRYLADGSPDPDFGADGVVVATSPGTVYAMALMPDGRIVVAGSVLRSGPVDFADVMVRRYLPDGSPDGSFGLAGLATVDVAGKSNEAFALVLLPDGGVIAAGRAIGTADTAIVQLTSRGDPDPAFGSGGKRDLAGLQVGEGLARQADGKLLLVGDDGAVPARFAMLRLLPDGSTDTGFGNAGLVTTTTSTEPHYAHAVAVTSNGRILVAGEAGVNRNFLLARYFADGSPDLSFNDAGTIAVDFELQLDAAKALVIQPDGRVVLGGTATIGTDTGFALVRVLP